MILLWSRALGDPERLFQGYFIVSLESAVFLSGSGPSLCLDTAHLCFLEEKGATTMLYFHGVCCESNHHPSRLLEAVTRCPHGQDLQAVQGQRTGSWPGLQRTDLRTACILQRPCCRNSSEAPAYMAAPS